MRTRTLALWLGAALSCVGAGPIGTVTSGGDFNLNGKRVQTAGVPTWPVSPGDEILSGASGAVLSLSDGTRLALTPNTKVVLQQCDRCVVQLFQGSTNYEKPAGSKFEMCALGHMIKPQDGGQGTVQVASPVKVVWTSGKTEIPIPANQKCSCNAGAPWGATTSSGMSAGKKAAIITGVAAAGAGATAAGIAVTKPSDKSPK